MGDISRPWQNKTYAGKGTAKIKLPTDEEKKKIDLGLGKFNKKTGTYIPIKKSKK